MEPLSLLRMREQWYWGSGMKRTDREMHTHRTVVAGRIVACQSVRCIEDRIRRESSYFLLLHRLQDSCGLSRRLLASGGCDATMSLSFPALARDDEIYSLGFVSGPCAI